MSSATALKRALLPWRFLLPMIEVAEGDYRSHQASRDECEGPCPCNPCIDHPEFVRTALQTVSVRILAEVPKEAKHEG